jgi:hypothetical protein
MNGMSEDDARLIEHNPHEKRPTNAIWWILWPSVALLWVWYLSFYDFDWPAVAIGGFTMFVLSTWAIEVTGNKVPDSWRSNSFRRD